MEKTLLELQRLQLLLFAKQTEYMEAIEEDKTLEQVKRIRLRVKKLTKDVDTLMKKASDLKFGEDSS